MDAALDRANSVRRGPDQIAVNSANAAVEAGRLNLLTARANLGALQTPADQLAAAAATTDNARRTLQSAQDRLSALRAGPPGDQLAMASSAVDNARRALQSAQATLGEVQSRPTHAELAELNSRVDRAQTAVQRAQVGVLVDEPDSESLDVQLLERTVDQDRVQVETLERDLAATRVTAPFAGTVSAVLARPGDQPERGRPVVVLAKPGNLIVRADLTEAEADRLAIGQKATVQLEGDDGTPLRATLAEFASTEGDLGRGALFEVSWLQRPTLGSIAQVAVTLQGKADVLLVPQRAVRTAGRRQYVEYLDGTTRRTIDVEVGRVTGGQAEIVSGLTEGQFVLVAP